MVDGYSGYDTACTDYAIIRLGCWAHARRYLVTAKKLQKVGKAGKADQGLAYIQKLYALERYQQRQAVAIPVLEKLRQWLEKSLPQALPNSVIGKALTYLKNQWARLIRYVDDGRYPIDNNPAENAIRPFTIGRKNWLFANNQAGANAWHSTRVFPESAACCEPSVMASANSIVSLVINVRFFGHFMGDIVDGLPRSFCPLK